MAEGRGPTVAERKAMQERPARFPLVRQNWRRLLFLHWAIDPAALRPFIPSGLELDLFEENAYLTITPFTITGARAALGPPLPMLSRANELNVRTYVHHRGVPGVWFFSLDIDLTPAVWLGRYGFSLPYYKAAMEVRQDASRVDYLSRRQAGKPGAPEFHAGWEIGDKIGEAEAGSLEFFLVERYLLFSRDAEGLYRARIWHPPWVLQTARLVSLRSTMFRGQGLPEPGGEPLVYFADLPGVQIWGLEKLNH